MNIEDNSNNIAHKKPFEFKSNFNLGIFNDTEIGIGQIHNRHDSSDNILNYHITDHNFDNSSNVIFQEIGNKIYIVETPPIQSINDSNYLRTFSNEDETKKYKYNRRHRNSISTFLTVENKESNNLKSLSARSHREVNSSPNLSTNHNNNNNNNNNYSNSIRNSNMHNKYRARRFSQDSGIATGKSNSELSDSSKQLRRSFENLKTFQLSSNLDYGSPLRQSIVAEEDDDFVDSPIVKDAPIDKLLVNKTMHAALSAMPIEPNLRSPSITKAFGPKIGFENIPGTPMVGLDILHDAMPVYQKLDSQGENQDDVLKLYHRKNSDKSDETGSTSGSFYSWKKSKRGSRTSEDAFRRVSKQDKESLDPESLMFRDGRRKIDMVLAWEEENLGVMTELEAKRRENRRIFQENMMKEGLELELEDKSQAFDEKTYFLKIHIPWRLEQRYAEVMGLKLPIKRFITISVKAWEDENIVTRKLQFWTHLFTKFKDLLEGSVSAEEATFKKATAGGNPEEQFIVKDRCTAYTNAQRSLMVFQILLRIKFDESERVGIRRLLNDTSYLACFPLHEGRYDRNHSSGVQLDRRLLYLNWARPSQWYKRQPLCLVRKYFGDKIALYFCWLGFYTEMLIYPSIVGTLCFLYGLSSMDSQDNTPSQEICDINGVGNITLCPLCDQACSYQSLSDSCLFARLTYLFDNPSTVFFAIFMSFWATTFLELWKRKQSVIAWEWDLSSVETDEEPRPEFETNAKTFRINPVTREKEPYMSTTSRAFRFVATSAAVFFMICVVLSAVLGTIIYRISLVSVIYGGGNFFVKTHAKLFTSVTAALINLVVIMILTKIYHKLAIRLTNLENPRTQSEYEDSYTFKIFFFEFMNFYSSLIYIAFFKGRFFDYPGDESARKSDFFKVKNDICDPAGCLSELCIQLAIIMVGKQVWNNFMEYLFPKFYNWWRQRKHKAATKDVTHLHMTWEQDYHMQDPGRLALFDEYLEMILQYGFITLFVAAFPLAPLFAFMNNVAEIRLDAFKMVTQARRPLGERVEDIGAWYGILRIITYAAVVSNAFVIAYTSDFIPRMVYKLIYSPDNTLNGYIEHSLSIFNTSDYKEEWGANKFEHDPDTCKYRGYRNGPDDNYSLNSHYWHVFAARLAFVVVFEHVVFVITGFMQFVIPDIPAEVKTQMQREQLLAKEAKLQHGLKKTQDEANDILSVLRDQGNNRGAARGSWARRISRLSDGLDAHVEVSRPRRSVESTVWEIT